MSYEKPASIQVIDRSPSVINRGAALARLGGSEELLNDMIGFFLDDAPALLGTAAQSVAANDKTETIRAAHSLKGLAANVDALKVVMLAQQLEDIGRTGQLEDALALLPPLRQAIADVLTECQATV